MAMKFERQAEGQFLLDVRDMSVPHPQIYTKKALEKMKSGDVLEIIFDNPSSSESIAAMINSMGNELIEQNRSGGKFDWKIRKG